MPYATCPNCKSTFHLNVNVEQIDNWNRKFPISKDNIRYIQCYFCWKKLKEYDVVEIWSVPEELAGKIDRGDLGAILIDHGKDYFEVECVRTDGTTKWLESLPRTCLWYKIQRNS